MSVGGGDVIQRYGVDLHPSGMKPDGLDSLGHDGPKCGAASQAAGLGGRIDEHGLVYDLHPNHC